MQRNITFKGFKMESTIYRDSLPSLLDNVSTTLGLVVFDELGASQLDFLWQISP